MGVKKSHYLCTQIETDYVMSNKENEIVITTTADGSHTLFVPQLNEHYHSVNGAVQESMHVFIDAGLSRLNKSHIRLLEVGFGTGLNALLALKTVEEGALIEEMTYYSFEAFPLELSVARRLNYGELVWKERKESFEQLHSASWEEPVAITDRFVIHKRGEDINRAELPNQIDLIFFDAFAPEKQPEMWSQQLFDKLYTAAAPGAVIVTYCAKGEVRRRMQSAGFRMQRLPGPPGKRHMLFGEK